VWRDPTNAGWQYNLAVDYGNLGDVLSKQNHPAEALKAFSDGVAIMQELTRREPTNAQWQDSLALGYWMTGVAWAKVEPKSKKEARAVVEKGRDILRQLEERTDLTVEQQESLYEMEADIGKMRGAK